ncbi:aminotransferase class III-fold pyridoxal phosphate-dependent enzyme [Streptomyces sp. PmtG]
MNAPTRYAEALLTGMLGTFGLDIEYVRAERNSLYYRDDSGAEVPVLDLVGGWGSLMLGHHHPEVVARAKELLDSGFPVHSQHSAHPLADQVGAVLNGIIGREFPGAEPYSVLFANSGAEAVEAAVKHCEFDRVPADEEPLRADRVERRRGAESGHRRRGAAAGRHLRAAG